MIIKSNFGNLSDLKNTDIFMIHNLLDSAIRMVIYVYTLTLAIMTFAYAHAMVFIVTSIMMIISLSYGVYVVYSVQKILNTYAGYRRINYVFYYVMLFLCLLLYLTLFYFRITQTLQVNKNKQ